jgi:CBS domain containing-hemolysin-like protein
MFSLKKNLIWIIMLIVIILLSFAIYICSKGTREGMTVTNENLSFVKDNVEAKKLYNGFYFFNSFISCFICFPCFSVTFLILSCFGHIIYKTTQKKKFKYIYCLYSYAIYKLTSMLHFRDFRAFV